MANATAYANTRNTRNTNNVILNPVIYWRVSAFALTAVAIVGVIFAAISGGSHTTANDQLFAFGSHHFLGLTWTHTVLHFVLAGAAFLFGFGNFSPQVTKNFAILFGFVYAGLGVLGFLFSNPLGAGALALNLGVSLNAVHLLIGAWALTAGFGARY
jgi:hypothetical protein